MRSWQYSAFGGPEQLRMVESETPAPGPGEARVRVAFCGVNPVDMTTLRGRFPDLERPHIPGSEIAGTVDACGPGVEGPQPGDRVVVAFRLFCGRCWYCIHGREIQCLVYTPAPVLAVYGVRTQGGYAEYVIAPARNLVAVPPEVPLADACAGTVDGATAYHLVDRAGVGPEEQVLVVGATGGVGSFAVQFAHQRGAVVWALGRGPEAAKQLQAWGAAAMIDREQEDVGARLHELTGGRGVDAAIDPIGAATWEMSTGALANGGRYATCGVLTGAEVTLNLGALYTRERQIIGSMGADRGDIADTLAALARGAVQAPPAQVFPFEEAPAAMQALGRPGRIGKVLLRVAGE